MKQLPAETIRLLSSSQVIVSVVSVVKELVENSLDANASSIDVKLENYGFEKIEVRDNGDGIKAVDVPVMAMKHYTSKISSSEDLESLSTYGFRGEALGSICNISQVSITTRTADDDFSTQYNFDTSGHIISQKPSHLGTGTTVTVQKLFKNLPVRKQFYSTDKKCKEEIKKTQKMLMAYGIIKPELRIMFTHNKTIIWQKNRVLDHKMAFMEVVGPAVMKNMEPFQQHREDLEIYFSGFVPRPDSDRGLTGHSNSEKSYIFINSRPVYQKEILKLVQQYYSKDFNRLFPIFFLNITIPPSAVDVNLLPDKSQVLVHNKESICLAIEESLISLYGPLNSSVSNEMNTTNNTSKDINEAEQEVINKSCTRINTLACTSQYSLSNDIQNANVQENRLVGNQRIYNHYSRDTSTEIEIPDNEIVGYDQFQDDQPNNVLCQDQQNKTVFNLDDNTAIQCENSMDSDSRNYRFQEEKEGAKTSADSSEITADKWSLGNAFKNSRAENLEPVQILIPNVDEVRTQKSGLAKLREESNNQIVKKTNVIKDKMGQITAYDLISNKVIRKSMSAFELFVQDYSPDSLSEITKLNSEKLLLKMEAVWNSLNEEEKKKYEEKAGKDLERYNRQSRKAVCQNIQTSMRGKEKRHKIKPKDCLNNQQKLDTLFNSQMGKKHDDYQARKTVQLPFSMDTFKQKLQRLEHKKADQEESCLIRLPNFPDTWILASEEKIEMLNPYRIEEALLFKKLIENHKLPIEKLDTPIILTESLFSDSHYMEVLCSMSRESARFDGSSYLLDPRLVANGFKIKIIPGTSAVESELEIEGMTSCLPYYGISDLKEILSAVINNNAQEVYECRPLKVVNYLEGEAVRLSRKLPLYLSEEDVQNTINRMGKQLGTQHNSCVHGRPFTHFLTKIPPSN
ncbi:PMS1 protein homolog 1 isoform X1 [Ahaetulla prasina]|uniref:PMS1 protein homolog 1 isoform X1 n=1 Tax=Ahaetulla prasina TaxID=499056 RepID=UPI0026472BB4|nr:PMS1 protein homolog 1 isoform X1 [Ahaetulla prasina]XP_058044665.1 PMS1 protein homolog 1 isoform X1 [Ahaetulla prasina]XP_058044674.1 PMS1 protein homolog 1 isoform X1 [Ahaetulla prasina]XP_058044684.1 PMS1 protein homolog 1 isoform X1 [Ahaetulla prasina]XP_058044693.1 PMS1 protein homolog 1 isoform X1 [Ahaetulla prasina]XP_058044699.1 PMS1 protein homolog 1 isoform X1 [Ahaetulla prasina]XP_058044706.1 PMS1 protein homolog 1 isoform X1 [Ahaetulla prasina]XP_058044715.1 PMS1 protein homo